jgi:hypothetical protein
MSTRKIIENKTLLPVVPQVVVVRIVGRQYLPTAGLVRSGRLSSATAATAAAANRLLERDRGTTSDARIVGLVMVLLLLRWLLLLQMHSVLVLLVQVVLLQMMVMLVL